MFIFAIYLELWTGELINRIVDYDQSLGQKELIKFIYYFMIIFLYNI
jgi:hypothetical protein